MNDRERLSDMPGPLRWFLVAFKQVGFPVLVCLYLGYLHFVEEVKNRNSQDNLTSAVVSLKASVDQQTKVLKHKHIDD